MKNLHIDLETFSTVDLNKSGVYRYAEDPDFCILLFGVSVDDGPVRVYDLAQGDILPQSILDALIDTAVLKYAHNASFERVCLSRFLWDCALLPRGVFLDPISWRCTMVWSAYAGLPLSLKAVGHALELTEGKMDEGKGLIKLFCTPCKPTAMNEGKERILSADAPEKWELFKSYNKRDVEVEMEIARRLAKEPVPDQVWEEYRDSELINDRGILVDQELVHSAIALDEQSQVELVTCLQELTDLENPRSVTQMKEWLQQNGLELDSLGKKEVAAVLHTAPEPLRTVLLLRQEVAKSSVKKYVAMENAVCSDGRLRGMFVFYGATRSGRFSGRIVQLQNLYRNSLPDLGDARALVKRGDYDALEALFDSVPLCLAEVTRTSFIASPGNHLIVCDYSAIEARVLAWMAGEQWRLDLFEQGGDIYCQSASQMFHVPVVKHGVNGELRQKGKVAELACIAEGQLVLTDKGQIPIEAVTTDMKVWDGEEWVEHEGVVYQGKRKVISYDGLTATPDHLVFIEGQSEPVRFGIAASCGAHLIQTVDGGRAIRLGEDYQSREAMEQSDESLLCSNGVSGLRLNSVADSHEPKEWEVSGMSELLPAKANSRLAASQTHCCKTEMRESKRSGLSELWGKRDSIRLSKCDGGGALSDSEIWPAEQGDGNRPDRYEQRLCSGESEVYGSSDELREPETKCPQQIRSEILALQLSSSDKEAVIGTHQAGNHSGCGDSSIREKKELAFNQHTSRLYDIRNAGRYHRFTISGHLVHNCGYGGSVGALKSMGALEMGVKEDELLPLVEAWRSANPHIVQFWWKVDRAVKKTIQDHLTYKVGPLSIVSRDGRLSITLPSGRALHYLRPRIGTNRFGGESITYMGMDTTHHWGEVESYGPKFVENCVAHDSLVITDRGPVPIQEVTEKMLIWDGKEFVTHEGVVCKGIQDTICVDGLRLTPDHRVYTKAGWLEARYANGKQWYDFYPLGEKHFIRVDHTPRALPVYDIVNAGRRHRFALWNGTQQCIVSNCTQAISRDILCNAIHNLRDYGIVAHVHDEVICDVPKAVTVEEVEKIMSQPPPWAEGLVIRGEGYETPWYCKDA